MQLVVGQLLDGPVGETLVRLERVDDRGQEPFGNAHRTSSRLQLVVATSAATGTNASPARTTIIRAKPAPFHRATVADAGGAL